MAVAGNHVLRGVETLLYYGAKISGISAIFSMVDKIGGLQVHSIFTQKDLPDYRYWKPEECPLCKEGKPIEGLWNGFGITKL